MKLMRGLCVALLMALTPAVFAADDFAQNCAAAAEQAGGPAGDRLCQCLSDGLKSGGGKAEELIAFVEAPRGEKRGVIQGASDGTRQVVMGCMRQMRGNGPRGDGPRGDGPRGGGPRADSE